MARQTTSACGESAAPRGRFTRVSPAVKTSWKIAAAVAAVCVALPMGAYAAANHAELFSAMFGDAARQSTPEQPYSFDKGDGQEHTVMVPSREYVPVDPEAAEALVGAATATDLGTIKAGNAELTVTSAVRSEHQMVVAFTLKQDPANPVLDWDAHTNVSKGALFAEGSKMIWRFETLDKGAAQAESIVSSGETAESEHPADSQTTDDYNGMMISDYTFVDAEKSTSDTLYCCAYLLLPEGVPANENVVLNVMRADHALIYDSEKPWTERDMSCESEKLTLATPQMLAATQMTSDNGASLSLSPLGLALDLGQLFSADEGERAKVDSYAVAKVVVNYSDGSSYVVEDDEQNIENTMNALNHYGTMLRSFNRLVDPSQVESVEVTNRAGEVVTYR